VGGVAGRAEPVLAAAHREGERSVGSYGVQLWEPAAVPEFRKDSEARRGALVREAVEDAEPGLVVGAMVSLLKVSDLMLVSGFLAVVLMGSVVHVCF
jgi:hypothetical protein